MRSAVCLRPASSGSRIIAVREPIELPFRSRNHLSRYPAMRLFMLAHPGHEAVPAMTEIGGHGTGDFGIGVCDRQDGRSIGNTARSCLFLPVELPSAL